MVCGIILGSLDQLLKFPPEHVVHLQLASDLFADVQMMGPTRIEIYFLQAEDVGICACEKIYDPLQLLTTVDIPVDDAQRTGRPNCQSKRRKVASDDFRHCHFSTVAATASRGKARCIATPNSSIGKLDRNRLD